MKSLPLARSRYTLPHSSRFTLHRQKEGQSAANECPFLTSSFRFAYRGYFLFFLPHQPLKSALRLSIASLILRFLLGWTYCSRWNCRLESRNCPSFLWPNTCPLLLAWSCGFPFSNRAFRSKFSPKSLVHMLFSCYSWASSNLLTDSYSVHLLN